MRPARPSPVLQPVETGGLLLFADQALADRSGIVAAFSTRAGGVSDAPYASLDLAAHTGDDPTRVDENRRRLLQALGLDPARLVTAEQVHGDTIARVTDADAGRGARAAKGRPPVPGTDALLTSATGAPLLLMYADCVPVILVAESPRRAVAVVHAGWKGALTGLPGSAAARLAEFAGTEPASLAAYIGPHVCGAHYVVSADLAGAFHDRFASVNHSVSIRSATEARVDLEAAVRASLQESGMTDERVLALRKCTVEEPELFYSYRAEGVTGRHGALAAIRA